VRVDTRKAIALLAILAVEGRPVRRDVLAARLWPEATQERARASLRRTLSALRTAVGSDAIESDRETIMLTLEPHTVDLLGFDANAATSPHEALDLYRGGFLEGFSVPDAPDFEDWQRAEAERFQLRVDGLLDALVADADPTSAIKFARRRLQLDPLNEAACRQVMKALGASGDRAGAVSAYRTLVRRLDLDLGVEPLAETTHVYSAVRRGDDALAQPLPRPEAATSSPAPALIGRTEELAVLSAARDELGFLVITGEPGIGRSRLLAEWAENLDDCLILRCHVGEQNVPYAPLAGFVARPSSSAQIAMFEEIAASLPLSVGGVLALDDLHLADPATMAFVTYVVHRRERFGWMVVSTWRTLRIVPGDPCWDLLSEGRREGWASELRLSRLEDEEAAMLVRAIDNSTAERTSEVVEFAEGLPLLVIEAMRLDSGAGLPPVVEDLMRTRLGSLTRLARQVVEALAVIDKPADERLLQSVSGRTELETASAVEELIAAEIVEDDGAIQLTHHLLGVVLLAELSESRERALHERAGTFLPPAEAADHLARAGRGAEAADLHLLAAEEAQRAHALPSALHHLQSALAFGRADEAEVQRRIGDIQSILGRYEDARRAYEISAARSMGADLVTVELKLARLATRVGDDDLAASHLDSAEAELAAAGDQPPSHLTVELAIGRALFPNDPTEASSAARHAIELAQLVDDAGIEAAASSAAALVALRQSEPAIAAEHAGNAIRLSQLADAPLIEAAAANLLGLLHAAESRYDEAIACFGQARTNLDRHGDVHRLAAVHANLGDVLHMSGREAEAREHQLESARLFSEVTGPATEGRAELWALTVW
jgi:DNA-binding SARP family transcriptional activator/tetratricopeptide (TPR) repeat protein